MDNPKTEETTQGDPKEPIISWSGVQGETQSQDVDIPNAKELNAEENLSEEPVENKNTE